MAENDRQERRRRIREAAARAVPKDGRDAGRSVFGGTAAAPVQSMSTIDQVNEQASGIWRGLPGFARDLTTDPLAAGVTGATIGAAVGGPVGAGIGGGVGAVVGGIGWGIRELVDQGDAPDFAMTRAVAESIPNTIRRVPGYVVALPAATLDWTADIVGAAPGTGFVQDRLYGASDWLFDQSAAAREIRDRPVASLVEDLGNVALVGGVAATALRVGGVGQASRALRVAEGASRLDPVDRAFGATGRYVVRPAARSIGRVKVGDQTLAQRLAASQFAPDARAISRQAAISQRAADQEKVSFLEDADVSQFIQNQAESAAFVGYLAETPRAYLNDLRLKEDAGLPRADVERLLAAAPGAVEPGMFLDYDAYRVLTDVSTGRAPEVQTRFDEARRVWETARQRRQEIDYIPGRGETRPLSETAARLRAEGPEAQAAYGREQAVAPLIARREQLQADQQMAAYDALSQSGGVRPSSRTQGTWDWADAEAQRIVDSDERVARAILGRHELGLERHQLARAVAPKLVTAAADPRGRRIVLSRVRQAVAQGAEEPSINFDAAPLISNANIVNRTARAGQRLSRSAGAAARNIEQARVQTREATRYRRLITAKVERILSRIPEIDARLEERVRAHEDAAKRMAARNSRVREDHVRKRTEIQSARDRLMTPDEAAAEFDAKIAALAAASPQDIDRVYNELRTIFELWINAVVNPQGLDRSGAQAAIAQSPAIRAAADLDPTFAKLLEQLRTLEQMVWSPPAYLGGGSRVRFPNAGLGTTLRTIDTIRETLKTLDSKKVPLFDVLSHLSDADNKAIELSQQLAQQANNSGDLTRLTERSQLRSRKLNEVILRSIDGNGGPFRVLEGILDSFDIVISTAAATVPTPDFSPRPRLAPSSPEVRKTQRRIRSADREIDRLGQMVERIQRDPMATDDMKSDLALAIDHLRQVRDGLLSSLEDLDVNGVAVAEQASIRTVLKNVQQLLDRGYADLTPDQMRLRLDQALARIDQNIATLDEATMERTGRDIGKRPMERVARIPKAKQPALEALRERKTQLDIERKSAQDTLDANRDTMTVIQQADAERSINLIKDEARRVSDEIDLIERGARMRVVKGSTGETVNRMRRTAETKKQKVSETADRVLARGEARADRIETHAQVRIARSNERMGKSLQKFIQASYRISDQELDRQLSNAMRALNEAARVEKAMQKLYRVNLELRRVEVALDRKQAKIAADPAFAPSNIRATLLEAARYKKEVQAIATDYATKGDVATAELLLEHLETVIDTWGKAAEAALNPARVEGGFVRGNVTPVGGGGVPRAAKVRAQKQIEAGVRPYNIEQQKMLVLEDIGRRRANEFAFELENNTKFVNTGTAVLEMLRQAAADLEGQGRFGANEAAKLRQKIALAENARSGAELQRAMNDLGYRAWSPTSFLPGGGVSADVVGLETKFMANHLHEALQASFDLGGNVEALLSNTVDRATNVWRTAQLPMNPRWLIANVFSNPAMVASDIGLVDMVRFGRRAIEALREQNPEMRLRDIATGDVSYDSVMPIELATGSATREALHDQRVAAGVSQLNPGPIRRMVRERLGREVDAPVEPGIVRRGFRSYIDGMYNINAFVDDWAHEVVYLAKIDELQGQTNPATGELYTETERAEIAVNRALKVAGDFASLSPIERRVFRRLMPFYAWTKHITKLSLHLIREHPGRVAWTLHMMNLFADDEYANLPPFVRNLIPLGAERFLVTPSINPYQDTAAVATPAGIARSLNPLIKVGVGATTSYDLNRLRMFPQPPGSENVDWYGNPAGGMLDADQALWLAASQFSQFRMAANIEGTARYPTGEPYRQFGVPLEQDQPFGGPVGVATQSLFGFGVIQPSLAEMRMRREQRELDRMMRRIRYDGTS